LPAYLTCPSALASPSSSWPCFPLT
jgi:hypothetical protein